jgi:MerR family mercuric resistance operon transcriptional regulator
MRDHETVKALTRGALAALTGCNIETIRYYETIGLLPDPPRSVAGHRRYDARHLRRLRFVMRARALGFSLEQIRGLLGLDDAVAPDCAAARAQAQDHLADVRARIADLRRIEEVLARTVAQCETGTTAACPLLDALEA